MANIYEPLIKEIVRESNEENAKGNTKSKNLWLGYSLLILINFTESAPVIASQLTLGGTSIFELSTIRYALQALFCTVIIVHCSLSFRLSKEHWGYLIGSSVFDYFAGICIYTAAVYLPVGTVQGVSFSFYIIITLIVDILQQKSRKLNIIIALIACSGIVFLTQPWKFNKMVNTSEGCIPCDFLDGLMAENQTDVSYWCYVEKTENNLTLNRSNYVDENKTTNTHQMFGFLLLLGFALSCSVSSNCCHKLVSLYPAPVSAFWPAVLESLLSLIVTIVVYGTTDASGYITGGFYCLIFALLFVVISAINDILWYFTFDFLPVSYVSLGTSPAVGILYISQRTFLKMFFPGYGNVMEIFGVLLAFCGAALLPLFDILFSSRN